MPDVIAPGLRVLFVALILVFTQQPSAITSLAPVIGSGRHSLQPDSPSDSVSPFDERKLLEHGFGITNVVMRATATADQLTREELQAGGERLRAKVRRYKPAFLAVLGLGAYRAAWNSTESSHRPAG